MKKIFSAFSIPFLLAGCAAIKNNVPFPEPKDGDRARIRVIAPSVFNEYRGVSGYPNSQCLSKKTAGGHVLGISFGFEKHLNGQKIGMPTTPFSQKEGYVKAEVYLVANQPVIFTFLRPDYASTASTGIMGYTTYYKGCTAKVGFTPKTDEDYELIFPSSESCEFKLNRLTADNGVVSASPVPTNDIKNCR